MLHVVIVGAGPAGLIAAETLARAGVRTTVVERAPERLVPCTGLLTQPAMHALGIPELLLAQRVGELALFSPTSRVAFVPLAGASGLERYAGVMRTDLLMTLLRRRAEEAGAALVTGTFRRFVHSDDDYPVLEYQTPDGRRERLSAEVVIGADGASSRVARAIGLKPLPLGVTYMEKLALPDGKPAPAGMQVHLGRKVSADRFAWLVPHGDHVVAGVATHARFGKRVWDNLAELKKRLGSQLDGAKPAGRESFMFPLEARERLVFDRVLLVGDAAGLGPAATFDGLYYAAMSGQLAAETILANRHMPTPDRLVAYETRFRAAHGAALAGAAKLEALFFVNDTRREALVDLARERHFQRPAVAAFMEKKPFALPFKLAFQLKTRLATSLLRRSLGGPRRHDGETLARAMPAGENYLDLALMSAEPGTGLATLPPLRDVLGAGYAADEADLGDDAPLAPAERPLA